MVQLELTQDEVKMLQEILREHLEELSMETAFTHRKAFHDFLRKKKEFMESFVQRLQRETPPDRIEAVAR